MNITIAGMWHLGCVISAGMAKSGHSVVAYDPDPDVINNLKAGKAPLFEPGLDEALSESMQSGRLSFTHDAKAALLSAEVLWIAFDTPVNDDDQADTGYVERQVLELLAAAPSKLLVLISSQMPVGTIAKLEKNIKKKFSQKEIHLASSPENLRLGQALNYFMKPDRVVIGIRNEEDRRLLERVFKPIQPPIEWMSVESAEMAKHAINSFLALSVTFANELAVLCEKTGADAREVERALKSESRIGPKAYLRPGSAFAGGTLARDVVFLSELAERNGAAISLIPSIQTSNEAHKKWIYRVVADVVGNKKDCLIAVLGLTYKPGTDTLRRSTSVEFCRWALGQGHTVNAHDPAVKNLPAELTGHIRLCSTVSAACRGASVIVVGTPWPEYRDLKPDDVAALAPGAVVVDANRFLIDAWPRSLGFSFRAVGLVE